MYLNVKIIQCVLSHLYFVNSVKDTSVDGIYLTTLRKHDNTYVGRVYQSHNRFCDMPERTWATICKHVTRDLRNSDGYVDVYVDFRATLMYSGKRCTKIFVWVPTISKNVKQDACVCVIRSSILALDIPQEYVEYNRKIMIYPQDSITLMVFEENKEQENYYPLAIYSNRKWSTYLSADVEILTTALPQSYGEFSNLQIILNPIFYDLHRNSQSHSNIVNRSQKDNFPNLCRIVLRRARYIGEIIIYSKGYIPKNEELLIVVLGTGDGKPKLTLMSAFICRGRTPSSTTIITNYKIAAGLNENSLMVLRETDCPSETSHHESDFPTYGKKCHEIVELIEHLSPQYINIYY